MTLYALHPLAQLIPGTMSDDEFLALKRSIQINGQHLPITLYENKILDGVHRARACKELDIEVKSEEFKGDLAAAREKVVDLNVRRRKISSMQIALLAARAHLTSPMAKNPVTKRDERSMSQQAAAVYYGISSRYVLLAVRVLNSNNTALIKQIEKGETTYGEVEEELDAHIEATTVPEEEDENTYTAPSSKFEVAGKRSARGRSQQTPASRVAHQFKALTEKERSSFVELAWPWLGPALRKAHKLVPQVQPQPLTQKLSGKAKRAYRKAITAKTNGDASGKAVTK